MMRMSFGRRRRAGMAAAAAAIALLALPPLAARAASEAAEEARECLRTLGGIEEQMRGAEMSLRQRDYMRDLIESARTFAENGNARGCRRTVGDLAEYAQEESIDIPLARQARDLAPFVADTPENLRDQPPEPDVTVPDPKVRVGETPVPLPVPDSEDPAGGIEGD